jgi:ABC-2 type transport system ATP-binding protein
LTEVELVCDRVVIISRGAVVAQGAPSDMVTARGVQIETDEGMKNFPDAVRDDVPRVVAALVAAGRSVYAVHPNKPTLEDVYIQTVGDQV